MTSYVYKDGLAVPVPPPREPMTIFDVLRKLIGGDPWNEEERREAYLLIGELEHHGILGNLAQVITTATAREDGRA